MCHSDLTESEARSQIESLGWELEPLWEPTAEDRPQEYRGVQGNFRTEWLISPQAVLEWIQGVTKEK